MENIYTQQHINKFFEGFKTLQNPHKIEKVHQLLNNPDAKATHKVSSHFKHLKLIIMTSAFIIGAIGVLFYFNNKPIENNVLTIPHIEKQITIKNIDINKTNTKNLKIEATDFKEKVSKDKPNMENNTTSLISTIPIEAIHPELEENKEVSMCIWPADTIIDKHSLYVYLNNQELERVGIRVLNPSGSKYYIRSFSNTYYNQVDQDSVTNEFTTRFSLRGITDTLCTTYRYGHYFYDEVDGLLPIRPTDFDNKNIIFWFDSDMCWGHDRYGDSIFKVLPPRYHQLKETFDHLLCLIETYPQKRFVNYIDLNRNTVLEHINWLELSKTDLETIGFRFEKNQINLTDSATLFSFHQDSIFSKTSKRTDQNVMQLPPLFPTLITDIKGLELYKFDNTNLDSIKENNLDHFNYLIPVFIPISKFIKNRNYDLVFWYRPTSEFIAALPKAIRENIKLDIKANTEPTSEISGTCTYFEICKSTLQLENFRLYPNPASSNFTIKFDLSEEINGSISIVNIAGAKLKTLVPNTTFLTGSNEYIMDLSGITPGIYLISVNTDKGFRTQRLIVSQ